MLGQEKHRDPQPWVVGGYLSKKPWGFISILASTCGWNLPSEKKTKHFQEPIGHCRSQKLVPHLPRFLSLEFYYDFLFLHTGSSLCHIPNSREDQWLFGPMLLNTGLRLVRVLLPGFFGGC